MLPLLDRFGGKEDRQERKSRRKSGVYGTRSPQRVCAWPSSVGAGSDMLMVARGSLAPPADPGLTLDLYPCFTSV